MTNSKTNLRYTINRLITDSSMSTVELLYEWLSQGKINKFNKVVRK